MDSYQSLAMHRKDSCSSVELDDLLGEGHKVRLLNYILNFCDSLNLIFLPMMFILSVRFQAFSLCSYILPANRFFFFLTFVLHHHCHEKVYGYTLYDSFYLFFT